jgi:hypothetical protein
VTYPTVDRSGPAHAPGATDPAAPRDHPFEPTKGQAEELKEAAAAYAGAASEEVRDAAREIKEGARAAARQTTERVRSLAARQKQAAAGQVGGFAHALRRASGDLEEHGQDIAARYVEQAADGLERASAALERRDLDELMAGVEEFARRQPVAFLGGAVVAGFGLARLLKSSAGRRRGDGGTRASERASGAVTAGAGDPAPGAGARAPDAGSGTVGATPAYQPGHDITGDQR